MTAGTAVGVLPGIGPLVAISVLFPITFHVPPDAAVILLAGIYFGAQYGGSTASILLNLPGTASNAVTCIDGYPMARDGRAGKALFMTTIASFFGGTVSLIALMIFTPLIVGIALKFGSPEYFALMVLGLIAAATLASSSPLRGIVMVVLGVLLSLVGTDVNTGAYRFTFGMSSLADGLGLVPLAMGLFGVAEVIERLVSGRVAGKPETVGLKSMLLTRDETRRTFMPMVRGSLCGIFSGILPGAGPSLGAFLAYGLEKRVSPNSANFGKGAIEGIAAPEAANNASVQAAFIPTLSLGIPGDAIMALILGALVVHGIQPGPNVIPQNPELFWSLVASFWIANILLLVLNFPLIGLWVKMLTIPYSILYPAVIMFICAGVFSLRLSGFDVLIVLLFGAVGYFFNLVRLPTAPLLLGFILGTPLEQHLRRAMIISRGDAWVFLERPISAVLLALSALLILGAMAAALIRLRRGGGMSRRDRVREN
ncbi:tripartite tricarboxylate transporter permease [Silicimonas algicola]|uniref:tripartite tricarboxylate transporter permease n=1 Tax=Silicimonas algicola TaxID=1826607 RepID=UPI001F49DC63|nr:tripartite tricarboxylate transporter permease [Silicimonas algicola]